MTRSTARTATGCTCGPTGSRRSPTSSGPSSGSATGSTRGGRRSGATDLGLYGRQLEHLYQYVDRDRVLTVRYKDIVEAPAPTVDRVCAFLGISGRHVTEIPRDNSRHYAEPGWRTAVFGRAVRAGAWLGQFAPPEVWRAASVPLIAQLSSGGAHRPKLSPEARARLLPHFAEDIGQLAELTGEDFSQWLSEESRGSFEQRAAAT